MAKKGMLKNQLTYFDGAQVKSLNPWETDDPTYWTTLTGDDKPKGEAEYFRTVPWLYRAVKDRSNNVGRMPFIIYKGKAEFDNSTDYANKLDWLDNPTKLFKQLEMSLAMCGKAYARMEVNKGGYIQSIKYMLPTSIKEHYNELGEIDYYERRIKSTVVINLPPEQVLALYDPDYMTENGPSKSSAAMAALQSAGVLYQADNFVAKFFERGAIKATILTTLGFSQVEAERMQHWWDDVVAGVRNAWAAIVVKGQEVKPVVIGEGLESLENESLTKERRQNIATAMGVPESRMWSAAANYATRVQDDKAYMEGTIIPDCDLIVEGFNTQVFTPEYKLEGYSLGFQYETLDIFQDDALLQAQALSQLTDEKLPLLMAIDLVGIDLTKEQRAELEQAVKDKQIRTDEMAKLTQQQPILQPIQETQSIGQPANSQATNNAMAAWQRKALKRLKENGSAVCEFISADISEEDNTRILAELEYCKTVEDVKSIFSARTTEMTSFAEGSNQIKRALEWLEKHDTPIVPVPVAPVAMPQFIINGYDEETKKLSIETSKNIKAIIQAVDGLSSNIENHQGVIERIQETIGNMRKEMDMNDTVTMSIVQALERISENLAKQGEQPAPVVNVAAPIVNVPAPVVNISKDKQPSRMLEVVRDNNGRITGIREK